MRRLIASAGPSYCWTKMDLGKDLEAARQVGEGLKAEEVI